MAKDELDNRKKKLEHLVEWQSRNKKADDLVPLINREKEKTEWEIEALENIPEEADEIPTKGLLETLDRDLDLTVRVLPLPPDYDISNFVISSGTATISTTSVYSMVARVGDIDTPETVGYSVELAGKYQELQTKQNRPNEVNQLLHGFGNQNTIERLEVAEKSFEQFKANISTRQDTANAYRNLLLGVNGDLWQKARKHERENMTWDLMAERLAKNSKDGIEFQSLIGEEQENSNLLSRLAKIIKDREGGSLTNLHHLRTQILDHLYTILTLIDL